MARDLLQETGAADRGYKIGAWMRSVTTMGLTWGEPLRLIQFSKPLMVIQSDEQVRDTILHECAHALVEDVAGHGPEWQQKALELGAEPYPVARNAQTIPFKWVVECHNCFRSEGRYRKPYRTVWCKCTRNVRAVMVLREATPFDQL